MTCRHAANGCNYPEGECQGACAPVAMPMQRITITRDVPIYAERMRQARKAARLSQGAVATSLDVHQTHLSRWEAGTQSPSVAQFYRWCRVLALSPNDALGWGE